MFTGVRPFNSTKHRSTKHTMPINNEKLANLYLTNPVAKIALEYFATRKRYRRVTTVERLCKALEGYGHCVRESEIKEFFNALEQLGCGEYKPGRWAKPCRFEWSVDLVSLGEVAVGRASAVVELRETVTNHDESCNDEDKAVSVESVARHQMRVSYPVRPGWTVDLLFPEDVTMSDMQRFANFLMTLPFHAGETAGMKECSSHAA